MPGRPRPLGNPDTRERFKRSAAAIGARSTLPRKTVYVVTAAQNATPIHEGFAAALQQYCAHRDAELVIIPFRYRNPTSRWTKEGDETEWWLDDRPDLQRQLFAGRADFGHVAIMGDIKLQATAGRPLARMDSLSLAKSGIFGHPRLQMKTVATLEGRPPKINTTTGAITRQNYTDTALGLLGEFHHILGAVVLEVDGKTRHYHLRHINARADGAFIDVDKLYTPQGVEPAPRHKAIVLGDWHKDFTLPAVREATFGPGGMVPTTKPGVIAWHDLDDNFSVNPHHKGDFFKAGGKERFDRSNARAELERACEDVAKYTPADTVSIIVPSNHNDFLARWLLANDPRLLDLENRRLWCESVLAVDASTRLTQRGIEYTDAFVYWAKRYFSGQSNIKVLERGESFTVDDIELGLHFDKGPNGARGSITNLRRLGVKVIGGHGHGPGIDEGAYQVGTSTGMLEYGLGSPSGWLNTHGTIDALGKRALLNIIDGEWRLCP